MGSKGAAFYLPAAGGFGSGGVQCLPLPGQGCAVVPVGDLFWGSGWVSDPDQETDGHGAGGSSPLSLSKAHSAAGNLNASCIVLFPSCPSFLSFHFFVTSVL